MCFLDKWGGWMDGWINGWLSQLNLNDQNLMQQMRKRIWNTCALLSLDVVSKLLTANENTTENQSWTIYLIQIRGLLSAAQVPRKSEAASFDLFSQHCLNASQTLKLWQFQKHHRPLTTIKVVSSANKELVSAASFNICNNTGKSD